MSMPKDIRAIAIHLPQFHPIPENDEWWGKGFTEWTNVTRARPLFPGHYQPHLPADLGFYDLRLKESLKAQMDLAREHAIRGFCYYHYWFTGRRILNRPLDIVLENPDLDLPFLFCWANENWSRRWDGKEEHLLMKQEYSDADDLAHIRFLCEKVFSDPRYIRIDGKPVFVIYRPALFPDIRRTLDNWREEARKLGIGELYLAYMQSFQMRKAPEELGFDAAIDFQPDFHDTPEANRGSAASRLRARLTGKQTPYELNSIYDYRSYAERASARPPVDYKRFPGITPMWDNTARRKKGAFILTGEDPAAYGEWLTKLCEGFTPYSREENLLFINAWNEWAEGNHLEPCQKWGRAYLEITRKVMEAHGG